MFITPPRALNVSPRNERARTTPLARRANLLVTLPDEQNDPRVKALAKLLTSPEVKQFIDDKYRGAVLPAF